MKFLNSAIVLILLTAISTPLSAADVTGKWTGQMVLGMAAKTIPFVLVLNVNGSDLAGTLCFRDCTDNKQPIQNAKLDADKISFSIITDASDVPRFDFQGTVSGDTITFAINGMPAECPSSCQVGTASVTRTE
jgi:hypothetical protein